MTTRLLAGESLMGARRRLDRTLEALAAGRQQVRGADHGGHGAEQIGLTDSPFLTLDEAARYLRFDDCEQPALACLKWLRREAVPVTRRGQKILIERRVLDVSLGRR